MDDLHKEIQIFVDKQLVEKCENMQFDPEIF